jgi:hypothetical protein
MGKSVLAAVSILILLSAVLGSVTAPVAAETGDAIKFANPSPDQFDNFGDPVFVSENHVLISSFDDVGATNAGVVHLFDTSGKLLHTFTNPTPNAQDMFGWSISMSGNYALISAVFDDMGAIVDTGAAYLYDITTGNLLHTYTNPSPAQDDYFGDSVSISGNLVLIGSNAHIKIGDSNLKWAGEAYLYDTSGNLLFTKSESNGFQFFWCQ